MIGPRLAGLDIFFLRFSSLLEMHPFSTRKPCIAHSRYGMFIRYGYEITLNCTRPTAMVCLLSVHEDRKADIRTPETVHTTPGAHPVLTGQAA